MWSLFMKLLILQLFIFPTKTMKYLEPSCSKFDFEEKVLEKLINLQHEMKLSGEKLSELERKTEEQGRLIRQLNETVEQSTTDLGSETVTRCPNKMTAFEGSCYFVGMSNLTFHNAKQFCRGRGSNLVKINTGQEQEFLREYLTPFDNSYCYWIGITDKGHQDVWTWLEDTTVPVEFTAWRGSEPNGGEHEDCACLRYSDYMWIDVTCTWTFRPLCEYRP